MPKLHIHRAGPGMTIQDLGRPGWTAQGLSTGGAADRYALLEAAALLDTGTEVAAIEMMGVGGTFTVDQDTRIAVTGARMAINIEGTVISSNRTHLLRAGQQLTIGGAQQGVFGYLAFAGGITSPQIMHSRATHLTAGIGGLIGTGDTFPLGHDPAPTAAPVGLSVSDRLIGGAIRMMPGPQTDYFHTNTLTRFCTTPFQRSPRGNRQGIKLDHQGPIFQAVGPQNIVSDFIIPGDVQIAGDGVPYVLLAECQTIGGYPRIGTVLPADLPKVAQATSGTPLMFHMVSITEADASHLSDAAILTTLRQSRQPLTRDPHDIADLLSYQLISGVTAGDDLERS